MDKLIWTQQMMEDSTIERRWKSSLQSIFTIFGFIFFSRQLDNPASNADACTTKLHSRRTSPVETYWAPNQLCCNHLDRRSSSESYQYQNQYQLLLKLKIIQWGHQLYEVQHQEKKIKTQDPRAYNNPSGWNTFFISSSRWRSIPIHYLLQQRFNTIIPYLFYFRDAL